MYSLNTVIKILEIEKSKYRRLEWPKGKYLFLREFYQSNSDNTFRFYRDGNKIGSVPYGGEVDSKLEACIYYNGIISPFIPTDIDCLMSDWVEYEEEENE